jgi:hypothetical protein
MPGVCLRDKSGEAAAQGDGQNGLGRRDAGKVLADLVSENMSPEPVILVILDSAVRNPRIHHGERREHRAKGR